MKQLSSPLYAVLSFEGELLQTGLLEPSGNCLYLQERSLTLPLHQLLESLPQMVLDPLLSGAGVPGSALSGIGIALPGVYDRDAQLLRHMQQKLARETLPLEQILLQLQTRYGVPVVFENDCNAAALGEYHALGGGPRDLVFLSLGSGLGAGVILGGTLRRGARSAAGEIGQDRFWETPRRRSTQMTLESCIGMRTLWEQFLLDRFGGIQHIPPKIKALIVEEVARYLVPCIVNINNLLDMRELVLGGPLPRILGADLYKALNCQTMEPPLSSVTVTPPTALYPALQGLLTLFSTKNEKEPF